MQLTFFSMLTYKCSGLRSSEVIHREITKGYVVQTSILKYILFQFKLLYFKLNVHVFMLITISIKFFTNFG